MLDLDTLDFEKGGGFVTVVAQDARTRAVLMVARADRQALERTLASGEMHYHSRSRGAWHKGATSGNVQRVVSLAPDCDGDAVLALVNPQGPACHTGAITCFESERGGAEALKLADVAPSDGGPPPQGESTSGSPVLPYHADSTRTDASPPLDVLDRLATTIAARRASPDSSADAPSYTRRLLADRNLRLKKLGEEASELVVACADGDSGRAAEEGADLLFHTLVALAAIGVTLDDVRTVLRARERR